MTQTHEPQGSLTPLRTDNIRSLTDFRENARAHLDRLAREGGVEVLTVNGEAMGVVMAPKDFDRLAELAWQAETTEKIRQGMAEIAAGKGIEAKDAMRRLAEEFGLKLKR